ncbi:hypothetical protein BJY52DRAFT_685231 [Lactarius psammicola]|nr:hypothetical protein BJY52DRAFT_685231 [Lactarius psammicola]
MGTQSHCPVAFPTYAEPAAFLSMGGSPGVNPLSLPSDTSYGTTSHMREIAQGESHRHVTTIGLLPDDVLIDIFDVCRKTLRYDILPGWKWHSLVHVCQRWRRIVFASPQRLNLQIICSGRTPVRKNLGIWPAFPIIIKYGNTGVGITPDDSDSVIAALEHPDRVCDVSLQVIPDSLLGKVAMVMQEPFPVLTRLYLHSIDRSAPVLPAEFLGGSAPCLQIIHLYGIPYPALPTLLLSTGDLVEIRLHSIPPTGYI